MCGRFTLRAAPQQLQEFFPLFDLTLPPPRFNVAPTQTVPAVVQQTHDARPHGALLRWGLVPTWAEDPAIGYKLINARADSVKDKPAFRSAFKKRRCLVLADGFYEWKKSGKAKEPYYIGMRDGRPFAFAGLWEHWEHWEKQEPAIDSCTIITTDANDVARPLHDRMPVILSPRDYERWLDPHYQDPGPLLEMLRPYPAEEMIAVPVSPYVNNARNEGPECLEKRTTTTQPEQSATLF